MLVKTNSETILQYIKLEYENHFTTDSTRIQGYYLPLHSDKFEKLIFPKSALLISDKESGRIYYKEPKYYGLYHGNLVKGMYDTKNNTILNLIRDPTRYFNICTGVIDYLFSKFLLTQNIFRIHAACVAKNKEGFLICGAKGTGKTTLLMKLLQEGYTYVADDQVYVELQNDNLICYPWPKTIKIRRDDITKSPHLYKNLKYMALTDSHGIERAIIDPTLNKIPLHTIQLPLKQIIVPTFSNAVQCNVNTIQPVTDCQYCVIDFVKKDMSFKLLFPCFTGADLLNIDYIENPGLISRQKETVNKVIQSYQIKLLTIGTNLQETHISSFLK